ncbi:uncharacterized protein LOC107478259 [Arachis duranensis]|uniref:Uncharacterized protein LOC107478259 n=1 Tax=Arachis duranensis TaxID=130453 RepID=A0A6P4CM09_ARADU|nr:uncharacterized protein LOC107478259 [Arachis duranensis]
MESQLDFYGPELLNSINCSGLPPHKLILKVSIPVMLLRNINQSSGLCNGTRLQVRKLGNHVIECKVLTGNNVGHIALILRINMVPTNETVPIWQKGMLRRPTKGSRRLRRSPGLGPEVPRQSFLLLLLLLLLRLWVLPLNLL